LNFIKAQILGFIRYLHELFIMRKIYCILFTLILFSKESFSQIFEPKQVPFESMDGKVLDFAHVGGIDNVQVNEFDLDMDGTKDLILFDRAGDILLPFRFDLQSGTYQYSPKFKRMFPKMKDWLITRDYNLDGTMDLFGSCFNTEGIPGIEVYKAINDQGQYRFDKFDMKKQFKALYFPIGNSNVQIPVDYSDLPAFDDVDGDGDLDIVLYEPGNNKVTWFQNVVKERGFSNDTLAYVYSDNCYGRFVESGFTSEIKLSGSSDTCASLFAPVITSRHAGSTILSLDLNGDALRDVLIGDLTNTGVIGLYNGGNKNQAWMTQQLTHWPAKQDSVNMAIFLGAFDVDVNHDGLRDVLIAPNQRGISDNVTNLWYYKNTGTSIQPIFQLQTKDLFGEQMVDVGSGSDPCFVDYNQDGLMDLVIGSEGIFVRGTNLRDARLFLFENIGTQNNPKFKLVDSNYLEFNQFSLNADAHHSFTPSFGDLDGDGDFDLLVGENQGQFFYCENTAGPKTKFKFKKPIYPYKDLSVKSNSSPFLVDLNRDGLIDIVSGTKVNTNNANNQACGSFYYFQNQGILNAPVFDPDYYKSPNTNCLGKIIVNSISSKSYTCPEIIDFNGSYRLFSGNIYGELKMIGGIDGNLDGTFSMLNPHYGQILEGERLTVSLADIDNDGILDIATGNSRGGIAIYGSNLKTDGTVSTLVLSKDEIILSPNPSHGLLELTSTDGIHGSMELVDMQGKQVFNTKLNFDREIRFNFEELENGIYLVKLINGNKLTCYKWIKI
jgi:hypothetical protein